MVVVNMIKQEDIAKILNVSRTTVARALNGSENIKPETKEKIIELAKELGYKKNPISSSLASKKKKSVYAFIIKSKNKYYTEEIERGLKSAEKEFKFYGFNIKIIKTDIETPEKQLEQLKDAVKEEVQGIIITPLLKDKVKEVRNQNPNIVFTTLDINIDQSIFHVGPNYFKSGRIAAEILINTLEEKSKVLVLDTVDDRISSKLYMNGFLRRMSEENNNTMIGPVYSENLMNGLHDILEKHMTKEVKSIYATRFLTDIVKYIGYRYNIPMKIVGNGMSDDMKSLILEKKVLATVVEQPYEEGYLAGKFMFEKLYKDANFKEASHIMESKIIVRESLF